MIRLTGCLARTRITALTRSAGCSSKLTGISPLTRTNMTRSHACWRIADGADSMTHGMPSDDLITFCGKVPACVIHDMKKARLMEPTGTGPSTLGGGDDRAFVTTTLIGDVYMMTSTDRLRYV